MKATLHTDGGARGNPGPAAYGYVLEAEDGTVLAAHGEHIGSATNNVAEYSGLVAGLRKALELQVPEVEVVSDSELMVKQMKGQYKVASPGLRPLWEEATRLAVRLERFEMRHTLRGGNKEADQLANDAMDKGMGRQPAPPAPTSAGTGPRGAVQSKNLPSAAAPKHVLEDYMKDSVVHLLEGDLPNGTFVDVIPK